MPVTNLRLHPLNRDTDEAGAFQKLLREMLYLSEKFKETGGQ